MYGEMMELIDQKVVEIFGGSFRGQSGEALFKEIMGIANGTIQSDPVKTAFAAQIKAAYNKAVSARES